MLPLEVCMVPRGQFMRKEISDDKFKEVLAFSTLKPNIRLEQIKKGIFVNPISRHNSVS